MVEAVAVVVEAGFGIEILCRETVAEEVGERARLGYGVAECVICVLRDGGAGRVEVAGYVAVVVIARHKNRSIDCDVKQAAYAASALQSAGEVFTPVVVDCRGRAVGVGDAFLDEIPVVVEEGRYCFRRHLADTTGLRIVEIRQSENAVRRYGLEAASGIVGECMTAIGEQIAVGIVGWLTRRHGVTKD